MQLLSVKGRENEIELCFQEGISFAGAQEEIEKLFGGDGFFTGTGIKISYSGAQFKYNEEMELSKKIRELLGEEACLVKKHRLSTAQLEYSLSEGERLCLVINKSLRSGETAASRGDIVIYGDVNPGATVTARGNITVLGALRGNACITECGRVFALSMQPSQIRIGKVYSYNKKAENVKCAYAVAENDEIILQCL